MSVFTFMCDDRVKCVIAKDYFSAVKVARCVFGHNRFELV